MLFVLCLGQAVSQQTPDERSQPPQAQPAPQGATKISPQEAEELFRSVDQILKFASQESALPIQKSVKRRLTSRDEVTSYLEKHMAEDEDAQRLKRSELVLKKFGLLPRDFDLQKFLIALLREQVAGYYDPKTKTVNLLDWIDADQQRPVLAHELTHALQDQSFGLEKWMKAGTSDLALQKKNPTPDEVGEDEVQTARQAVVEGQAMVVLIDYMLAPTGQSILNSPQIAEARSACASFAGARLCSSDQELSEVRCGSDGRVRRRSTGRSVCRGRSIQGNVPRMARRVLLCG
jgi:hypothetical protein